jgi:hypothetical protein
MVKEKEKAAAADTKEPITIDKFIFRGGELVTFEVGGKFLSFSDLIQLGDKFVYFETNEKGEVGTKTEIIVTDLGSGKYLSTKEKGEPIERTFAKLIS